MIVVAKDNMQPLLQGWLLAGIEGMYNGEPGRKLSRLTTQ